MFRIQLFREKFAFCIEKLQHTLKGINSIIKIHMTADAEVKRLRSELLEKNVMLEYFQAKLKVERSVFQQTSNESDSISHARKAASTLTGPIRVSSLFSSSSYGSSILETSRCLNEIQRLSDAEVIKASKTIMEPKMMEERFISELLVTIFQYSRLGLTPATFSTSVADFKYRLASLSVPMLPASSLELMMRFIRNPVIQLSDNPFYENRLGLRLLMEWVQSIACQVYSRTKSTGLPLCGDMETDSWVSSVLKKHFFLDDAASALSTKISSSIEVLKCRILQLTSEIDPLLLTLQSIKAMEPLLQEIKAKSKAYLRKLCMLEQHCEEICFMYCLTSVICLPFCRENQDRFFDIIKNMTSDESLMKSGTVLNTIYSRFAVSVSKDNPLSFQFLQSLDMRSFISLCSTIINAQDSQFLFSEDLNRFSDSQTIDDRFMAHAISSMCSSKVILLFQDPFSNQTKSSSGVENANASKLEHLVKQNEIAFSNTVSCCSELARFCERFENIVDKLSDVGHIHLIPLSTNSNDHDPLYSMDSIRKIKEYGSHFAVKNGDVSKESALFRFVLPINAYSVLKSIQLEGIPLT